MSRREKTKRRRILLYLSGKERIAYEKWPVTQGIPFPDGVLEKNTAAQVVDEEGHALPTQTQCLTTWNKDLKYVKWLLADFQADWGTGRQENKLFLEYGEKVKPVLPAMPVTVEHRDNAVQVNTGTLQFILRRSSPNIFVSCKVKVKNAWHEWFPEDRGFYLYMKDQQNNNYDSCAAGPQPQIIVEEAGPLRACVCIKGYHSTLQGQRFCPYILRMHFFAGKSDIRIFHTFIFDQEPHRIELKAVGLKLPLNPGKVEEMSLGNESAHWSRSGGSLSILQRNDQRYEVKAGGKNLGTGKRAPGWVRLQGSNGSLAGVMRHFWEEYPKGFVLAENGLDIQIWPEEYGETLKFTTPFEEPQILFGGTRDEKEVKRILESNPKAPMNLKSFNVRTTEDMLWVEKIVEKYGQGRAVSYNDISTDNGMGAAKTTEIYLRFSQAPMTDPDVRNLCETVQEPLIAPAAPVYACATKAVGHAYHSGDSRFLEIDAGLDDILRLTAIEPIEKCGLYGMMRYGNMVCSHSPGPAVAYGYYKDKYPEKALRYVGPYNNESDDQIGAVWGNFIRTGRREHYFLAQGYSRNVADVGFIHAHPTDSRRVGLMHYHNAHQWSGGPSPSHSLIRGLLLDYYFTGNRRLLEVALENADWCARTQEPAGIISCRHGVLHREFTGPLWNLLEAYQATWEEKYGGLARRSLNWFLRTMPEPGTYPVSVYTRGDRGDEAVVEPANKGASHAREVYYLFEAALRLFPSKKLRKHIVAEADQYVWNEPADKYVTAATARKRLQPGALFWKIDGEFYWTTQWGCAPLWEASAVCLAYDLTGDPVYAAYAKYYLEKNFLGLIHRVRKFADFSFSLLYPGSFIPRLMQIVAKAAGNDPAGFAGAERAWRNKRRKLGMPVYDGSGVDLDKDTMDVNGDIINRLPVTLPCECPARMYEPRVSLGRITTEDLPR